MAHEPAGDAPTRRRGWLGWVVVALVLLALVGALVTSVRKTTKGGHIAGDVARGKHPAAPALSGSPLTSNAMRPVSLTGKVTVVNFWASWCGPCDAETKDLTKLDRSWAGTDVQLIGADPAAEDARGDAAKFVDRHHVDYRVVRFPKSTKGAWGVTGYPETFVVGRTGKIVAKFDGPIDVDRLDAAVQAELGSA